MVTILLSSSLLLTQHLERRNLVEPLVGIILFGLILVALLALKG